jgi:hypothetical protein
MSYLRDPRWSRLLTLAVLMVASGGCSGPTVVPVTGKVHYRGKPLARATVTFVPLSQEPGKTAIGVSFTDDEGKFTQQTRLGAGDRLGTMPGDYRVAISKFVPPSGMSEAEYQKKLDEQQALHIKGKVPAVPVPSKQELIPADHSDTSHSKLTATVKTDGPNEFFFDIP